MVLLQATADYELSECLPQLGQDIWILILSKLEVKTVLTFAIVNKATSELVGDDSVWKGMWFAKYHQEFYDDNERLSDSLNDRSSLLLSVFEVSVVLPKFTQDELSQPLWKSWREKVLWRATLRRCGSDVPMTGCRRLYSRANDVSATNSSQLCSSCTQASSLVELLQDFNLSGSGADHDD